MAAPSKKSPDKKVLRAKVAVLKARFQKAEAAAAAGKRSAIKAKDDLKRAKKAYKHARRLGKAKRRTVKGLRRDLQAAIAALPRIRKKRRKFVGASLAAPEALGLVEVRAPASDAPAVGS